MPFLDLLLARNRRLHRGKLLVIDEDMHVVAFGEAFDDVVPMLPDSSDEIGSNAGVQRAVTPACEDVDGWTLFRPCDGLRSLTIPDPRLRGLDAPSSLAAIR